MRKEEKSERREGEDFLFFLLLHVVFDVDKREFLKLLEVTSSMGFTEGFEANGKKSRGASSEEV